MQKTPQGLRLQIGILGRRNCGKSSLFNAITRQQLSIVSDTPGTTTDPVLKAMELLPLGPVVFYDTAGLDDVGLLGEKRADKTRKIIERIELAILVATGDKWGEFEEEVLAELLESKLPVIIVFNKIDLVKPDDTILQRLKKKNIPIVFAIATEKVGVEELRLALIRSVPKEFLEQRAIVGDIVPEGSLVVLVTPIDKEAPRGRMILPQVQTIRDLLDNNSFCLVLTEKQLSDGLTRLKEPPALVVTDSQAFKEVDRDTPEPIPLTSFSILFARNKGDLTAFVEGALAIDKLKPGDHILVAEACTHHPIQDDIGTVKIPNWLQKHVGGELHFHQAQGHDYFEDAEKLKQFALVIHCGACTFNRKQMLWRIEQCRKAGVPVTNYGLTIAYTNGIFERALKPFPEAWDAFKAHQG